MIHLFSFHCGRRVVLIMFCRVGVRGFVSVEGLPRPQKTCISEFQGVYLGIDRKLQKYTRAKDNWGVQGRTDSLFVAFDEFTVGNMVHTPPRSMYLWQTFEQGRLAGEIDRCSGLG